MPLTAAPSQLRLHRLATSDTDTDPTQDADVDEDEARTLPLTPPVKQLTLNSER